MSRPRGRGSRRDKSARSLKENAKAELILRLAVSSHSIDLSDRSSKSQASLLNELISEGTVEPLAQDGDQARLVPGLKGFRAAFITCDNCGKSGDLLRTRYAREAIGEGLLDEVARDTIYVSILCLLRLLTYSNAELRADPSLNNLAEIIIESEGGSEALEGITLSLDEAGFYGYLDFYLGGVAPKELDAERTVLLEQLAQKDVELFFGTDGPISGLSEGLKSLLYPRAEREELLRILERSRSAMRLLLLIRESRSALFVSAALRQVLPLLVLLFELFAIADPATCDMGRRRAWSKQVGALIEQSSRRMPSPSPLLLVMRDRMLADTMAER